MSASKIESTSNYSRFKPFDGNRPVNQSRVKKLMRGMKRKNMLQQFPIVCQKNGSGLYIMDGQHRYEAAKALGLPIFFVESRNITIEDMAATNSVQKGWSPGDFISSFAAQGNKNYIALKSFMDEHGLGAMMSAGLLSGSGLDNGGHGCVASGAFKVQDSAFAGRVANTVKVCAQFFPSAKQRGFVYAIGRLHRLSIFSATRLLQKLEHQRSKLIKCPSWIDYVGVLEEIYNWKVQPDQIAALTIEVKRMLARGPNREE